MHVAPVIKKIKKAIKKRNLPKAPILDMIDSALQKGIISQTEAT